MLQPVHQNITDHPTPLLKIIDHLKNTSERAAEQGSDGVKTYRYDHPAQQLRDKVCACGCSQSFQTSNNRQKYINPAHRQRAYRNRQKSALSAICGHCGQPIAGKRSDAKFCSNSCTVMAHRVKREQLIDYLTSGGMSRIEVMDRLELEGMRSITNQLKQAGIQYSYELKQWGK